MEHHIRRNTDPANAGNGVSKIALGRAAKKGKQLSNYDADTWQSLGDALGCIIKKLEEQKGADSDE